MDAAVWSWLAGEAGASWVVGIIGVIVAVATYVGTRRRSSRIEYEEVGRYSLLDIGQGEAEHIMVGYEDDAISSLSQWEVILWNTGTDVIDEPRLLVSLPESTKLRKAIIFDSAYMTSSTRVVEGHGNQAVLRLPFVNPAKEHKHAVHLVVLAEGRLGEPEIVGMGRGWSVRRRAPKPVPSIHLLLAAATVLMAAGLVVQILGYMELSVVLLWNLAVASFSAAWLTSRKEREKAGFGSLTCDQSEFILLETRHLRKKSEGNQ